MNFIDVIFMRKTFQKMSQFPKQKFVDKDVFEFFNQKDKSLELEDI